MELILAVFGFILFGGIIGIFLYLNKNNQQTVNNQVSVQRLEQLLNNVSQQNNQQMQHTVNLILQQLNNGQQSQEKGNVALHTRLDHATKAVSELQGKLIQMEEANKKLFDIGKDISSLQAILQAPKLRGTMGEIWLKDLIGQIIPKERFAMQYKFKSGETCDSVIFLRDGLLLPIDSKFSLENFTKMIEAEEKDKDMFRKAFISDTKKRIDEISNKYIKPGEGTLEFAFMYVPAENVYYQAFIQNETEFGIQQYAFNKKVIPVSPSSFYAYLQVIMFGLKGMEIEKSAIEIQKNLGHLQVSFDRFRQDYSKIGSHLKNAQNSYESGGNRLEKIENRFIQISDKEKDETPGLARGDNDIINVNQE